MTETPMFDGKIHFFVAFPEMLDPEQQKNMDVILQHAVVGEALRRLPDYDLRTLRGYFTFYAEAYENDLVRAQHVTDVSDERLAVVTAEAENGAKSFRALIKAVDCMMALPAAR